MKTWARIENKLVAEIVELPDTFVPGIDIFADGALMFTDVSSTPNAAIGWVFSNGVVQEPPSTNTTLTSTDLLQHASRRQNAYLNGIYSFDANSGTGNTALMLTTRLNAAGDASMTKLVLWGMLNQSNAVTEAYVNIDMTTADITPAQALSIGTQAGAVISKSYASLKQIIADVDSGNITTTAQIDEVWPVSTN